MSWKEDGSRVGSRLFLFTSAFLIAVTVGVFACSDGSEKVAGVRPVSSAVKEAQRPRANPYAFVGKEHNKQVDFVLREFHKRHKKGMQKKEQCALLDEIISEYNKARKRTDFDFRPTVGDALCGEAKKSEGQSIRGPLLRTAAAYEDFSQPALDLAYEVENIMLSSYSAAGVADALAPIISQAQSSLSGNDAALVLAAAAVAQSSAYYWEANFDYWADAFTRDGTTMTPSAQLRSSDSDDGMTLITHRAHFEWSGVKAVGWADVGGGITGGIRGAFAGPEGVVAGAATGAAYASIGAALGRIFAMM